MILIALVLLLGLSIFITVLAERNDWNIIEFIFGVLIVISIAILITCGIALVVEYTTLEGNIAEYQVHYDSLIYQLNNNIYKENLTGDALRELYKEIQHWNCDLAKRKVLQNDFWIGIFYPNIYDNFDFISLEGAM